MKVGIVVFDGFDELDAVGPYAVLRAASQHGAAIEARLVTLRRPSEASAIWLPPSLIRTEEQRDRAGLTAVVSAFSDGARARYDAVGQDHDRVREAARSVPHWYLVLIGVDPARQGLGLGSLLLRAGLSRVDQDGVERHLFTEESRNVPLYQRYGFEIAVDGDLPDGGPHFWFMRRRPHPITR